MEKNSENPISEDSVEGRKPDTKIGESLNDVIKHDWEQTKADLPGLKGEDTGQTIADTIHGEVHE